jgi:hypothetical protein
MKLYSGGITHLDLRNEERTSTRWMVDRCVDVQFGSLLYVKVGYIAKWAMIGVEIGSHKRVCRTMNGSRWSVHLLEILVQSGLSRTGWRFAPNWWRVG